MQTIGIILFAIGFVGMGSGVIYELVQHRRTGGPVFQGRKRIVFPWVVASWVIGVSGILVLFLHQQG